MIVRKHQRSKASLDQIMSLACVFGWIVSAACIGGDSSKPRPGATEESIVSDYAFFPAPNAFQDSLSGSAVQLFVIRNAKGMKAALTNYGARMIGLWIPDRRGKFTDVVLGFDSLNGYLKSTEPFFGAVVGRYGNRIAKGRFSLGDRTYQLDINNEPNCLHGGRDGFHTRVWEGAQADSQSVRFRYEARDGEGGFPGKFDVEVEYRLTDNNELEMSYSWFSDKTTVANVTNHNFWNLNGAGTVGEHSLQINAGKFTQVDATLIPTGIMPVEGTPFDFRNGRMIADSLSSPHPQLAFGNGYDHNYVLDRSGEDSLQLAAVVQGNHSGIRMEVWTTEPGLQFYGGNFMQSKNRMKGGLRDDHRTAFCLETQHFPDSPNQPDFPSTLVIPGRVYQSKTMHRFSLR